MPLTNAEKQAAHRAKKEQAFEQISLELSKSSEENRILREKVAVLEGKLAAQVKKAADQAINHTKKLSILQAKLLEATEK